MSISSDFLLTHDAARVIGPNVDGWYCRTYKVRGLLLTREETAWNWATFIDDVLAKTN